MAMIFGLYRYRQYRNVALINVSKNYLKNFEQGEKHANQIRAYGKQTGADEAVNLL